MKVAGRELTPLQRATLDRKLGQAYFGLGNYEQCVALCVRALGHLGVHYPKTRWGVRRKTVMLMASHFLGRKRGDAGRLDLAIAQEISTVCRSLAWLDFFVDEERFMLDSLIELHAAERSGNAVGRVRGVATLGIAMSLFRAHKLPGVLLMKPVNSLDRVPIPRRWPTPRSRAAGCNSAPGRSSRLVGRASTRQRYMRA